MMGRSFIEQAILHEPDIVLLDIGLPLLNGYEACRRILEKIHPHPPIMIALTGWGQDGDRQKSQEAGFSGHLVKPVDLDVLLSLLPELMAKRPLSTECGSHSLKTPPPGKGTFIDLRPPLNSSWGSASLSLVFRPPTHLKFSPHALTFYHLASSFLRPPVHLEVSPRRIKLDLQR